MLEKILTKMAEKVYPKRNISVEKIGGRLFLHSHDTTGCNDYLTKPLSAPLLKETIAKYLV